VERLARDKHSSLIQKFVNYGQKKFYEIDFWQMASFVFFRKYHFMVSMQCDHIAEILLFGYFLFELF
jgi:hypothetical protein